MRLLHDIFSTSSLKDSMNSECQIFCVYDDQAQVDSMCDYEFGPDDDKYIIMVNANDLDIAGWDNMNNCFSEFWAMYALWNMMNEEGYHPELIGFCHYRRHFMNIDQALIDTVKEYGIVGYDRIHDGRTLFETISNYSPALADDFVAALQKYDGHDGGADAFCRHHARTAGNARCPWFACGCYIMRWEYFDAAMTVLAAYIDYINNKYKLKRNVINYKAFSTNLYMQRRQLMPSFIEIGNNYMRLLGYIYEIIVGGILAYDKKHYFMLYDFMKNADTCYMWVDKNIMAFNPPVKRHYEKPLKKYIAINSNREE